MNNLRNEIENETTKRIIEWADDDRLIERFTTELMYKKYRSGELSQEKAYKKAYDKMLKTMYTERDNKLAKLEKYENAQDIERVKISVEWKKSAMWGNNPHVELSAYSCNNCYTSVSTASGCGYDKESQAVANALDEIYGIRKLLIENLDYIKEKKPYGINLYGNIPSFSGGVGVECYRSFFEAIGWKWEEMHGKTYDCYILTRGGK